MRAHHLIDEDEMILLDGGEVDRLAQFLRQPQQERPWQRDEVGAGRCGKPQDRRPEAHAPVRRRRDDQLLGFERGDDALHRRAGEIDALGDLPEAQSDRLLLQRAQNRGGARDHLHLTLFALALLQLVFLAIGVAADLSSHVVLPNSTQTRLRAAACRLAHALIRFDQNTVQKTKRKRQRHDQEDRTRGALSVARADRGYWRPTMAEVPPERGESFCRSLTDFGEQRLQDMDRAGIGRVVLSIAGPGVQVERDAARATSKARESNDFLAAEIQKRPDRYSGFAHLGMQDPKGAADELERCMRDLKFCGAMINGQTNGQYLDAPALYPFWERAEALGAVIYLHPADPAAQPAVLSGYKGLMRPMWGWGFETGSHALRLVVSGHFDRFPRSKLMLGHLGETLPFLLWRFDSRAKFYGLKLNKHAVRVYPREHLRHHVRHVLGGAARTAASVRSATTASCSAPTFRSNTPTRRGTSWTRSPSTRRCARTSAGTMRRACSG